MMSFIKGIWRGFFWSFLFLLFVILHWLESHAVLAVLIRCGKSEHPCFVLDLRAKNSQYFISKYNNGCRFLVDVFPICQNFCFEWILTLSVTSFLSVEMILFWLVLLSVLFCKHSKSH